MSPTVPEVLQGLIAALATPLPDEAGADYRAARISMSAMLANMAAQEAERGIAAWIAENADIQRLLLESGEGYGDQLGLVEALSAEPTLSSLQALNADLRRRLIALHEEVERRGDRRLDAAILDLYQRMARGRALELPIPAGG